MEAPPPLLRLRCSVQSYDWGRSGDESAVARLFSRNSAVDVEPGKPYAEFWMGTLDSGPSFVVSGGGEVEPCTLKSWIRDNPGSVGDKVVATWGADLPFLFKVLSVAKALSIQAHPDKELAKVLHEAYPNVYKDSNHKPEMAVAITEFKALCGFITTKELKDVIATVPEITELVGAEVAAKTVDSNEQEGSEQEKSIMRLMFTRLMSASKEEVTEVVSKLARRLKMESEVRMLTDKEELVLLLENQYAADVGVISAFFFNYVKLNPGEALFLGANEPHAYIYGECIECMATSDNVVRAGLTPKFRDVQTLCSMLTYKQGFPEILQGVALNPYTSRYTPPFDEFEVDRCLLPGGKSVVFPAVPGPSIFVVVAGEGCIQVVSAAISEDTIVMEEGGVFFVPAQTDVRLNAGATGSLQVYRAGSVAVSRKPQTLQLSLEVGWGMLDDLHQYKDHNEGGVGVGAAKDFSPMAVERDGDERYSSKDEDTSTRKAHHLDPNPGWRVHDEDDGVSASFASPILLVIHTSMLLGVTNGKPYLHSEFESQRRSTQVK